MGGRVGRLCHPSFESDEADPARTGARVSASTSTISRSTARAMGVGRRRRLSLADHFVQAAVMHVEDPSAP
jgi:hypothetical protein